MNSKKIIGELTLHSFGEISKHEIAWVPNYGVTCSSLFTSNGDIGVVVLGLESRLDVSQVAKDIPDRQASLVINGNEVIKGQVYAALKAACAKARVLYSTEVAKVKP